MADKTDIRQYEERQIRTHWDEENEQWYFSIVDVIAVLTDQPDSRHAAKYWSVLKTRLKKEGSQLTTNCRQLKITEAICHCLMPITVMRQLVTNCQQLK